MSPTTFTPNAATSSAQVQAAAAEARAAVTSWHDMTERGLADFGTALAADLQAGNLANLYDAVPRAAAGIFGAAGALVATTATFAAPEAANAYTPAYRAEAMAKAAATTGAVWQDELTAFDESLGQLVKSAAQRAYPKVPADADAGALWAEAADILDASDSGPLGALMNLAAADRRDLAAAALSPRASTWAGAHGLTAADLQRVRSFAIEAARTKGEPSERAAARVYGAALELHGWRAALVQGMKAAANAAAPGKPLPFAYRDVMGTAPNLLEWHEGPNDAPPIVTV